MFICHNFLKFPFCSKIIYILKINIKYKFFKTQSDLSILVFQQKKNAYILLLVPWKNDNSGDVTENIKNRLK